VELIGTLETSYVSACVFEFDDVLLLIQIAQNGAFLDIDFGFIEIGLGLNEIGIAFFGVVSLFGALLIDLMGEIVKLGAGFASGFDLIGGIELGEELAGLYAGTIFDDLQQSELRERTVLPRDLN
jgi:hypothetical protein